MKKSSNDTWLILKLFLLWRVFLTAVAIAAGFFIPVFGARFPYADRVLIPTGLPSWIWGFGNFDGVHYLRIAQDGYQAVYSPAFFPLFPLLVRLFNVFPKNALLDTSIYVDPSYFYTAFILSNVFFLAGLLIFYKLIKLDHSRKTAMLSVILLLVFPTSFYFGSVYTESLFLLLTVSSLYLLRKKSYLASGLLAAFASATRLVGLFLLPMIAYRLYLDIKSGRIKPSDRRGISGMVSCLIAPLGALIYMLYLKLTFNNPLYFLTAQPAFGAQRSDKPFILLPQVFYRYIKIFLDVPVFSLGFFNAALELIVTLGALVLIVYAFRRVRLEYWFFSVSAILLPTLTGTFSSMPRYVLTAFLLTPLIAEKFGKSVNWIIVHCLLWMILLLSMFIRGYWIA